jgi:hypothetical protein
MANHHGTEGLVKVGANTVAEVTGFNFTATAEYAEDTTLGDTAKTYSTTAITSWSGSVSAYWDETDTTGQVAIAPNANVALKLYPEGATTGDVYYYGDVLVTEITRTVARGAVTEIAFSFVGNGVLTTGTA